jgi:DNA-directed RNA polymerase subunit N (RpoN/RPB10)
MFIPIIVLSCGQVLMLMMEVQGERVKDKRDKTEDTPGIIPQG